MPYSATEFIRHVLTCSRRSLGSLLLSRQNMDANLRKELRDRLDAIEELIEKIVQNRLEMKWAQDIRDHGEEIMAALTEGSDEPTMAPRKSSPNGPAITSRASGEN